MVARLSAFLGTTLSELSSQVELRSYQEVDFSVYTEAASDRARAFCVNCWLGKQDGLMALFIVVRCLQQSGTFARVHRSMAKVQLAQFSSRSF
jgi:hypothetical protein